jgi:phosphoenolpyruvate-protein phosphotransferase (PTS system enzyme I)
VKKRGQKTRGEVVLQGIGVCPGVAMGPVFILASEEGHCVERRITSGEIPREIVRFEEAVIETRRQLNSIQKRVQTAIGENDANIFDVHKMVLDDGAFIEESVRRVQSEKLNAEAAVRLVAERYASVLAAVEDDYLRERVADVKDVARRVLRNLSGGQGGGLEALRTKSIVVANDLTPSETATLHRDLALGFATDLGSATSHTAIMARALGIPAVVGLSDISVRVSSGDRILIDGTRGVVVIRPTEQRLAEYGKKAAVRKTIQSGLVHLKAQPAETRDGRRITLSANVELLNEIGQVKKYGACGIGLFRSEYLYIAGGNLPSEDDQFAAYREAAARLAPDPVIIRTLDLGGDKFLSSVKVPHELNPFMGFRAIRFCLAQPDIFKTQLRAILRASAHGKVCIMYPMISNVEEVIRANALLEECKKDLHRRKIAFDEQIEVGVMIEIPSAALTADVIAPHVKFFSLGTNDLVQYTMAVDRVNERVAHLYEPTHPAVLKLIQITIAAGHALGLWVGVCGQMGGDPLMTSLLLGLGVDELSMVPSAVPVVKDVIRSITLAQAKDLAQQALAAKSAAEVMQRCRDLTAKVAPEVLELVR